MPSDGGRKAEELYDDTGYAFYFFLLSLLTLYLVPATISRVKRRTAKRVAAAEADADEPPLTQSEQRSTWWVARSSVCGHVVFAVAWALFLLLAYLASQNQPQQKTVWNPWEILGVEEGAEAGKIKQAYRALSLKWHPDKNKGNEEEAERRFVEITKAYEALTDPEAMASFEKYGNPDNRREMTMGIALPRWMIQGGSSYVVLAFYLVLLVLIVVGVFHWWRRSRKYAPDDMLRNNVDQLKYRIFMKLKSKTRKDHIEAFNHNDIMEELYIAPEFVQHLKELPADAAFVAEISKNGFKNFPRPAKNYKPVVIKAAALLYAHVHRLPIPKELEADHHFVITKAVKLLRLIVDLEHVYALPNYYTVSEAAIEVMQMIIQGVWQRDLHEKTELYQLPHMQDEKLLSYCLDKKKEKDRVKSVRKLLEKPEEERRAILRQMEDAQYNEMIQVARKFPILDIVKTKIFVTGEPDVHAGDVVTIHIKCLVRYGENPTTYDDGEESSGDELGAEDARLDEAQKKKKKQLLEDSLQRVIAYAPRFPEPKQQKFWVFVVDKQGASFMTDVYGRPLSLQEVNGTIKTKRGPAVKVDFLLPTRPSDKPVNRKLRVFVMCDSYYGAVATADVELNMKPRAGPAPDVSDAYRDLEDENAEAADGDEEPEAASPTAPPKLLEGVESDSDDEGSSAKGAKKH